MSEQVPTGIHSRRTVFSIAVSLFGLLLGVGGLISLFEAVLAGGESLLDLAAFSGAVVLGFWGASTGFGTRYLVTLEGIQIVNLRGRTLVRWVDVGVVRFQTDYFGNYVVTLHVERPERKKVRLPVALVGSGHEVGRAIIEAASVANPGVRFAGARHYGPPPYGIFADSGVRDAG